jgi:hypothetical protein
MKTFGGILIALGLFLLLYAITMDTTVAVSYSDGNSLGFPERVNNIGLMNDKSNYTIISLGMIIIGILIRILNKKSSSAKQITRMNFMAFMNYKTLAENDVEKGDYSSAINNYQLTLFHLESDFANLPDDQEIMRQNLIENIKLKIIELKNKA